MLKVHGYLQKSNNTSDLGSKYIERNQHYLEKY